MAEKILEIRNLKKYYGKGDSEVRALDDVSFDIYKGEMLVLLGNSGCGKSTLLNIIFLSISYVLNDLVGTLNTTCYVPNNQVGNVVTPNITKSHFHDIWKVATFVLRYVYKCLKINRF